jgi:flavin-dependent dehydrogenase
VHADVIIIGHRIEAHLLSYLFSRRGFRTLLLSPGHDEHQKQRLIWLDRHLAGRLKPVGPPVDTILARHVNFQLWSPDEKNSLTLRELPLLVVDEVKWCRFLELQCSATRNFRALKGHPISGIHWERGAVGGVVLGDSKDIINARLVIECDTVGSNLQSHHKSDLKFPEMGKYYGKLANLQRAVGAAASAWQLGAMSIHVNPGRHLFLAYRFGRDELELSAIVRPGVKADPQRIVGHAYQEAGLDECKVIGQFNHLPYLGPPLPILCRDNYLAAGEAAGHCNPFIPYDRTSSVANAYVASVAAIHCLGEGLLSMSDLWEYPRSVATDEAKRQAAGYVLASSLCSLETRHLDNLFATGLFDTYVFACLMRNQSVSLDLLDSMAKSSKALTRPGSLLAWRKIRRRADKLKGIYGSIPNDYNPLDAAAWQDSIVSLW